MPVQRAEIDGINSGSELVPAKRESGVEGSGGDAANGATATGFSKLAGEYCEISEILRQKLKSMVGFVRLEFVKGKRVFD